MLDGARRRSNGESDVLSECEKTFNFLVEAGIGFDAKP